MVADLMMLIDGDDSDDKDSDNKLQMTPATVLGCEELKNMS